MEFETSKDREYLEFEFCFSLAMTPYTCLNIDVIINNRFSSGNKELINKSILLQILIKEILYVNNVKYYTF